MGIVLLNYNGWQDTLRCLTSLDALAYGNVELVVVDNHSTDESVRQIRRQRPAIELVSTVRNLGFAGGNNVGIRRLLERGCDAIWLLNNDTIVAPAALTSLVETCLLNPSIGAVGSVLTDLDQPDQILAWGGGWVRAVLGRTGHIRHPDGRLDFITGASLFVPAAVFADVGLLDDRYFFMWEDVEFAHRLRRRGWQLAVAAGSRVGHAEGGTCAAYTPFHVEQHARGLVLFCREHTKLPWLTTLPIWVWYLGGSILFRRPSLLADAWRGWRAGWRIC